MDGTASKWIDWSLGGSGESTKYRLRDEVKVYLYVSTLPCENFIHGMTSSYERSNLTLILSR